MTKNGRNSTTKVGFFSAITRMCRQTTGVTVVCSQNIVCIPSILKHYTLHDSSRCPHCGGRQLFPIRTTTNHACRLMLETA